MISHVPFLLFNKQFLFAAILLTMLLRLFAFLLCCDKDMNFIYIKQIYNKKVFMFKNMFFNISPLFICSSL